jgi:hypothetical protein
MEVVEASNSGQQRRAVRVHLSNAVAAAFV